MVEKKKPDKIFKTFRSIVRAVGDEEGVIDILIPMSTGSVDRHGEAIDPKGWKKSLKEFKKRSILISSHNYGSLQNQIGELLDLQVVEEGLLARPKYYINQGNPEADWGYFIASKGKAAFSVGFIPIKWEDSDGKDGKPSRTYLEQELIEISHVTVPSNRDAIMGLQAKGIDDPIVKEVVEEILKDKEAAEFYDSRLLIPDKRARELLLELAGDNSITYEFEGELKDLLKDLPLETEEQRAANEELVKAIITEAFKEGVKVKDIDIKVLKASMGKDDKDPDNEGLKWGTDMDSLIAKIYEITKENKELKRALADIELEAGAVLNTKNKSNLKKAQVLNQEATALVQSVLDSAGSEEGLKDPGKGGEIVKKDDTVITIIDTKKDDPPKDAATDKKTITIDDKILKEAIAKALNYTLGITNK